MTTLSNYLAGIVEDLIKLRHLPMVISSAWIAGQFTKFRSSRNLSLSFGVLVVPIILMTILSKAEGLSPITELLLIAALFISTKLLLQCFSQVLRYLIQICDSYERSLAIRLSPNQENAISKLLASKSTNATESNDSVKSIRRSGFKLSTDVTETDPVNFRQTS